MQQAFAEAGIPALPEHAYEQFEAYLDLLLRWNERVSLTAVREPGQIIRRHFVECAFASQYLPRDIQTLLDYGSGAGLPGIPMAICLPGISVTLAEAQGKKAAFLKEVLRVLGLKGEVYDGRVEAMPEQLRFDAVAMRAVEKMALAVPVAVGRAKRYLLLLTTEQSATAFREIAPELEWQRPVPLPNTVQMILAIGQRT
ncbi:MAG: 16S rRNA (guanine(527)-N(7))-methyltransferase RsmG [Acidobacteriaceae bacterium]|jgi:16S rRNA (guanine527-N7)-methyltransferase